MKASIPEELIELMDERILLDLEIHILNNKFIKAEQEGKDGFANHIEKILKQSINKRYEVNKQLKANGAKIFEPISADEENMFMQYNYSVYTNGGYKEGHFRYWRDALKLRLKTRMKDYFVER